MTAPIDDVIQQENTHSDVDYDAQGNAQNHAQGNVAKETMSDYNNYGGRKTKRRKSHKKKSTKKRKSKKHKRHRKKRR